MALLTMSDKELSRIDVIKEVLEKRLKQQDAASILGIGAPDNFKGCSKRISTQGRKVAFLVNTAGRVIGVTRSQ